MRIEDVTFRKNESDTHCLQCTLWMMMDYLRPNHPHDTLEKWEKFTGKRKGEDT